MDQTVSKRERVVPAFDESSGTSSAMLSLLNASISGQSESVTLAAEPRACD